MIQQKFPGDRLVVVGDFNAYTSNVLEITPEFFSDDNAEVLPEVFGMPRSSDDQSRRMNIWGRNLLAYCEENGLAICNGRFGKDRGRGEYTCFSGPNPSVID